MSEKGYYRGIAETRGNILYRMSKEKSDKEVPESCGD